MTHNMLSIEDVEYISKIVFKEAVSQVNNAKKDKLVHSVDVTIPTSIFRNEGDNIRNIMVDEKCAEKVLKNVEGKLTDAGYKFYDVKSGEFSRHIANEYFFAFALTKYDLSTDEIKQLEKEDKRTERFLYCGILYIMLSFLALTMYTGVYEKFLIRPLYILVSWPILLFLSCFKPVRWKFQKKYIENP